MEDKVNPRDKIKLGQRALKEIRKKKMKMEKETKEFEFDKRDRDRTRNYLVKEGKCYEVIFPAEDETLEESIAIMKANYNRHERMLFDEVLFLNRTNNLFVRGIGKLVGMIILTMVIMVAMIVIVIITQLI